MRPTLAAALLLTGLVAGCQTLPRPERRVIVTDFYPTTPDGWTLAVKRFHLSWENAGPDMSRLPVILCHGLNCNGRYWDLTEETSLARYLALNGYDVWVPSLRGAGASTKPGYFVVREMMALRLPNLNQMLNLPAIADPSKFNWSFDDYALKDLPTIIDEVKKNTAKSKVLWVGHSMGGMAMYAYLERSGRSDVQAFVALGSPIHIPQPPNAVYAAVVKNRQMFRLGQALLSGQLPATLSSIPARQPMDTFYYNRQNMKSDVIRRFLLEVVEDVPDGVIAQLLTVAETGYLLSADYKYDYTAELGRVGVPVLCVAGKGDNMAEPAGVRFAYQHVGSQDKTYRELSLVNGFSADYGHMDLVLGRRAREEVFPVIYKWLRERDGGKPDRAFGFLPK